MSHRAALLDLDQTLYDGFAFMDVMHDQERRGIITPDEKSQMDASFQDYVEGRSGYVETVAALVGQEAAALKGQDFDIPFEAAKDYFAHNRRRCFPPFGYELVGQLGLRGYEVYLVTSEPDFIAEAAMAELGAHSYISSNYEMKAGRYTGKVEQMLANGQDKVAAIQAALPDFDPDTAVALGDSEADVAMLSLVKHAFCINPSAKMREVAAERGWPVVTAGVATVVIGNAISPPKDTQDL